MNEHNRAASIDWWDLEGEDTTKTRSLHFDISRFNHVLSGAEGASGARISALDTVDTSWQSHFGRICRLKGVKA